MSSPSSAKSRRFSMTIGFVELSGQLEEEEQEGIRTEDDGMKDFGLEPMQCAII